MAQSTYNYEFFDVSFPAEHVAHVEINRPEKLNAFKQPYGSLQPLLPTALHSNQKSTS